MSHTTGAIFIATVCRQLPDALRLWTGIPRFLFVPFGRGMFLQPGRIS
jgi:hypothetical protein